MLSLRRWGACHLPAVALLCGLMAATACAAASSTVGTPDQAGTGAPKVNRLVFGIGAPAKESNRPHVMGVGTAGHLMPMYEFLVGLAPEGQEDVPQLATEWRIEPDGKSYRFKLRPGTPFHRSMGELTAKDVRFTWEDMKNETEPMNPQPTTVSRQDIQDVDIVNDHEVIIRLSEVNSGFISAVSGAENVFPIRSKADSASRQRPPTLEDPPLASTGPYEYVAREQGRHIQFKRVPGQHWRKTAEFPEFEWRFFKEPSTMLAALLTQEIHAASLPPELVTQATKRGMRAIPSKAPGQHAWVGFRGAYINKRVVPEEKLNPDPNATWVYPSTPLLDVRVRKALNIAIDREALNRAFLEGKGQPIYNEFFHPNRPGWNPAWERNFKEAYGYDPQGARRLLAEAGYGQSNPLTMSMQLSPNAYFPAVLDMDEAVGNFWQAVGVNVTLDQPDAGKNRALEPERAASITVSGIRQWLGPSIYNSACCAARSGVPLPELDNIYAEIRKTVEPKRYDELWRQWGDLAYMNYVNAPLFWLPTETAVHPAIVADYTYPGTVSFIYTHVEYFKAAK